MFDSKKEEDLYLEAEESMSEMFSTFMHTSISLTKIIVENRQKNSKLLNDQDILDIFSKSFSVVGNVMNTFQQK